MKEIRFFSGKDIPLERHRVYLVRKLNLLPVEEAYKNYKRQRVIFICCTIKIFSRYVNR